MALPGIADAGRGSGRGTASRTGLTGQTRTAAFPLFLCRESVGTAGHKLGWSQKRRGGEGGSKLEGGRGGGGGGIVHQMARRGFVVLGLFRFLLLLTFV